MKIAVIGGVNSSALLVEKLRKHMFDDVHVFGYLPNNVRTVSGWANLAEVAARAGYRFTDFVHVAECQEVLRQDAPDWLFAVGLSQLIPPEMLALARRGCIGFHPTALPQGRGRAPIAWLVLERQNGAATFFKLREGVDDGDIVAQVPFSVGPEDDAETVEQKVLEAEAAALDQFLPALRSGILHANEQDQTKATYYGRRAPEDGWIEWSKSAAVVRNLVQASTTPHPGAYTFYADTRITVLKAEIMMLYKEKGVVGRIIKLMDNGGFIVQCGKGLLGVSQWTADYDWKPRIGQKLGYYVELEVFTLRQRINELERRLADLERGSHGYC